ncbi:ankyrin, partial [Eremomyces bilateralis CBS 781.70]
VDRLLEHDAVDASSRTEDGETPLHIAASGGHDTVVDRLLKRGIDVNSKDQRGQTPLHKAAAVGDEGVVQLLLKQASIDFDLKDNDGRTPLALAVRFRPEVVKLLLKLDDVHIDSRD